HCESGHQFPANVEPGLEIDCFTHILLHTDDASSWVPFNTPVVNFESVYEAESSAPETDVVVATVKGGEALFTVDGKTATEVAATALYDTKGQNELVEVSYTGLTNLAGVVFPGASAQVIVSHKPVTIYLALHRELATAGSVPTITIGEKTYTPEATDKYHVYEVGKVTEDGEMFYDYASVYTVTVAPEHIFGAPVLNVPAQPASVRAAAPAEGEAQHTLNGSDALVKYIDGTPVWSNDFDAADLKDETGVSGIEAIIAAGNDSEVVFYNLQGIRVEGELAPGMYIRRQGNTAVKVCVK
ncbi:MAG: hypothetical protein K2M00_10040, partial [Muribaculaceae bacterium]|nr:hypothetical protein [Muribaculaceae bacterium]